MAPFLWLQVGTAHWQTAPIPLPAKPTKISKLPKLTHVLIVSCLVNTAAHFGGFQLHFVQFTLFPHSSLPLLPRAYPFLLAPPTQPPQFSLIVPLLWNLPNASSLDFLFNSGFQSFLPLPFLGATCAPESHLC